MGKKRKKCSDGGGAGSPAWMATYSDMVTLLLTFFVLMMAMANFDDTQRSQQVIESLQESFGMSGFQPSLTHTHTEKAYTEPRRRQQAIQPSVAKIREAMAKHLSDDVMRIAQKDHELRVRLDDRVFFKPGSHELHPAAYALVSDLAAALVEQDVAIRVEGHTDASGDEHANWQLSAQRALSVVEALQEKGPIDGKRLEAVAYGSHRVASDFGETDEWNRRVELVLLAEDSAGAAAITTMKPGG